MKKYLSDAFDLALIDFLDTLPQNLDPNELRLAFSDWLGEQIDEFVKDTEWEDLIKQLKQENY